MSTPHARMLKQLLPPGVLWSDVPGSVLERLLTAIGDELARVETRALALVEEADPRTATETLPEWESFLGLPDEDVLEIPATVEGRRIAVVQKLLRRGGQHGAYFVQLAAACGYTASVVDGYGPTIFRTGRNRAGQPLNSIRWAHVWTMNVHAPTGPSLTTAELERIIRRVAPSHTAVLFNYI